MLSFLIGKLYNMPSVDPDEKLYPKVTQIIDMWHYISIKKDHMQSIDFFYLTVQN